jgi:hypothetical protein
MHSLHRPKIVDLRGGRWMVECLACRQDHLSEVPIGIGMPLPDRLTAERLAENHRRRQGTPEPAASESLGQPKRRPLVVARSR